MDHAIAAIGVGRRRSERAVIDRPGQRVPRQREMVDAQLDMSAMPGRACGVVVGVEERADIDQSINVTASEWDIARHPAKRRHHTQTLHMPLTRRRPKDRHIRPAITIEVGRRGVPRRGDGRDGRGDGHRHRGGDDRRSGNGGRRRCRRVGQRCRDGLNLWRSWHLLLLRRGGRRRATGY
jgi:hypothetical protein